MGPSTTMTPPLPILADVRDLLADSAVPRVSLLNLQDLVATQAVIRFPEILETLRHLVDVVILDVPSFLTVHHGQSMLPLADVVLVVAERRFTTYDQLRQTNVMLKRLDAPVVGMALTKAIAHDGWLDEDEAMPEPPSLELWVRRNGWYCCRRGRRGRHRGTPPEATGRGSRVVGARGALRSTGRHERTASGGLSWPRRRHDVDRTAFPLVIIAILIAVALFALGQAIIRRVAHNDPWLTKALTVCLLLHLACAPAQIWVVDHIYGGISDYNGYISKGAILSNGFRHLDFSLAPAHLPGIVSDGSVSIVTGVVFAIIGVNKLGAFFVFSFLSFVGIVFFYRAFTTTFGRAGQPSLRVLAFLPSHPHLLDRGCEQGSHHDLPARSDRLRVCPDTRPSQGRVLAGHCSVRRAASSSDRTRCCWPWAASPWPCSSGRRTPTSDSRDPGERSPSSFSDRCSLLPST